MFSFFVLWVLLGCVFQLVTLPLAPAIGFGRQMRWASTAAAALAAYYVWLS